MIAVPLADGVCPLTADVGAARYELMGRCEPFTMSDAPPVGSEYVVPEYVTAGPPAKSVCVPMAYRTWRVLVVGG